MLSQWKKWIADRVGHRTAPRRRVAARFRGQFESLETRNVLSATIGVLSLDVVAVRVEPTSVTFFVKPEFEPIAAPDHEFHSFAAPANGQVDSRGPLSLNSAYGEKAFYGNAPRFDNLYIRFLSPPSVTSPPFLHGGGKSVGNDIASGIVTETIPSGGPNGEHEPPVGLTDAGSDPAGRQTNDGRFQSGFDGGLTSQNRFQPLRYNVASAYLSSAVTMAPTTVSLSSLDRNSLKSHDAAFESLLSDSLLLAVDGDLDDEGELLGDPKDNFNPLEDSSDKEPSDAERSVADNLAESLDALQCERAAVDAVLAELHDIRLTEKRSDSTATQSYRDQSDAEARDFAERFFIARSTDATQSPYDASAGGMVLLAATGDANSSAYDLAPATSTGFEDRSIASLAVEAPVGLYQAIDVGVRPTQSTTVDNISTTQPEMKVQTNVSAENAPAKKSEQPS